MPSEAVVHVVDDDMAVRQSLSFLLASDGWPVRLHESASAFLDGVKEAAAGHHHRCPHAGDRRHRVPAPPETAGIRASRDRHDGARRRALGGRSHERRRGRLSREAVRR